mmetsp:Transcript_26481/g.35411  ORF Transcript_26481/g.35411 Transcript_26481/m.35411 type:complete len:205 (+) Transcript_26481:660-1274(+)
MRCLVSCLSLKRLSSRSFFMFSRRSRFSAKASIFFSSSTSLRRSASFILMSCALASAKSARIWATFCWRMISRCFSRSKSSSTCLLMSSPSSISSFSCLMKFSLKFSSCSLMSFAFACFSLYSCSSLARIFSSYSFIFWRSTSSQCLLMSRSICFLRPIMTCCAFCSYATSHISILPFKALTMSCCSAIVLFALSICYLLSSSW